MDYRVSAPTRFFLLVSGAIIWAGIWRTGFAAAHWLLYVPAVMFPLAAATGICPGMIFSRLLFRERGAGSGR